MTWRSSRLRAANACARSAPIAVVLLLLLLLTLPPPAAHPASAQETAQTAAQAAGCRNFPQTGKQVCGRFLQYWDAHGGLAQQGYPVSGEMRETSDTDGKSYTVQYFERAVFEAHPENRPPYDVLLSLLGSMRLKQNYPRYPEGAAAAGGAAQAGPLMSGPRLFPQTGRMVGGLFLRYWDAHGGLAQQGYPVSDLMQERSPVDGKLYLVQYFERAVFEYHPENAAPYDVLLSLLGSVRFRSKYPAVPAPSPSPNPPPPGDPFAELRARPLQLPRVAPGAACPATPGRIVASDYGPALGNGPVYAVGFGERGTAQVDGALAEGGLVYVKVLWISAPAYRSPALVRGARIDAPGEVRFGSGATPGAELPLGTADAENPSGWREWRTYARIPSAGCYALQVDGAGFSQTVVFPATINR